MKFLLLISLVSVAFSGFAVEKYQERTITISNITYTVKYELKSTEFYTQPLTNPLGQPHYDCTATILCGTNQIAKCDTQWTEKGCFEDSPILLVGQSLHWKRYLDNSAGKGLHWIMFDRGGMTAEPDDKPNKSLR